MATVTRRGKSYSIRVSCGYDMTGRQIIRKPQPDMTDAQAEKRSPAAGRAFRGKNAARGKCCKAMCALRISRKYGCGTMPQSRCAPLRLTAIKAMLPRINAAIGHIRLDRLQPHHLMQFYSNLEEAGIREDGKQHFKGDLWQMLRARSITKNRICRAKRVCRSRCLPASRRARMYQPKARGAFLTRWASL